MRIKILFRAALAVALVLLVGLAATSVKATTVSPPVVGTPSAAGQAAPETVFTQWVYTSLDNQGGHAFGQPGNERVTFTGPTEVVVVGDGALEYNHNGDTMLSADCAPTQYGTTFCIPNTGSVMHISVPAGITKVFYCWGGSCSWWVEDSPTRLPNLVCQTLVDGCGPQGNGCYNGVFVTADWQNQTVWEHQWLGPQGPMGGVHFAEGTFGSAVLAGSCEPASTPTPTATPTATTQPPTATPTRTPTATAPPTATPTATTQPPTACWLEPPFAGWNSSPLHHGWNAFAFRQGQYQVVFTYLSVWQGVHKFWAANAPSQAEPFWQDITWEWFNPLSNRWEVMNLIAGVTGTGWASLPTGPVQLRLTNLLAHNAGRCGWLWLDPEVPETPHSVYLPLVVR